MSKKRKSIVDVAKELGVSHTTISRVVNGKPGVSAERSRELRQQLKDMGYKPRAVRPGPRPSSRVPASFEKSRNLAFLYLDTPERRLYEDVSPLLTAASRAAQAAGFNLTFAHILSSDAAPTWLQQGNVAGAVVAGRPTDERLIHLIDALPAVWLTSHRDGRGLTDRVISGNQAAGKLAAEYFARRGHPSLACINAVADWGVFRARQDAFELTARQHRLPVTNFETPSDSGETIFSFDIEQIEARTDQLVERYARQPDRPTGVFIVDSPIAHAFYRCAPRHGLKIGVDLDLASFVSSGPAFTPVTPRPASILVPQELRGQRAVDQLIWRIEHAGDTSGMEVGISPQIIPGEIDWPPPSPPPPPHAGNVANR